MLRTRLSRASLAALAIAALASGSTLVSSSTADASPRIDPGFGRGPVRIDPGIGNGTKGDPGFTKNGSPKFTAKQAGHYGVQFNCRWIPNPGSRYRDGDNGMIRVCD